MKRITAHEQRALDVLTATGPRNTSDIAAAVGLDPVRCLKVLENMYVKHLVVRQLLSAQHPRPREWLWWAAVPKGDGHG